MTEGGHGLRWLTARHSRTPAANANAEAETGTTADSLHRRYLADVFAYVARRVPDPTEAEDITAEVFAAAFAALPRSLGPHGAYPWLLGIARRKIADFYRRTARRGGMAALPEDLAAPPSALPEAALTRAERGRRLQTLLAALPPDQREALLLHYLEDLPHAQIAAVLGRSPAAVNSLLQRARAAVYKAGYDYFLGDSDESEAAR